MLPAAPVTVTMIASLLDRTAPLDDDDDDDDAAAAAGADADVRCGYSC
jgi:hypothetical protein